MPRTAFLPRLILASRWGSRPTIEMLMATPTYASDHQFLKKYTGVIQLRLGSARALVVPAWQARVMTSALSPDAPGFGWINREFIESRQLVPHINAFGGEDRFWLGPEGGQFSVFFQPGSKFDLADWQTPPLIDTVPFPVVSKTPSSVTCRQTGEVSNFSGTNFQVQLDRTVRLLGRRVVAKDLAITLHNRVKLVAYESVNTLKNIGRQAWNEKSGLLSIWILGQLRHSPTTTVVAPYLPGGTAELGEVVNDDYFGKVPSDRLAVAPHAVYFRADGNYRSKIGLNPKRALDVLGSWDPVSGQLTIVKYTKPAGVTKYVNSKWEIQEDPYNGDCVNSYNDGPSAPGAKPLGPFYEIESSSPAAELKPGESMTHTHRTFHFEGDPSSLDAIARKVLGVGLNDIQERL
jgi:hypothetical protein